MNTTDGMTIEQLHAALGEAIARGEGGKPIEIPYDPGVRTMGGQPALGVQRVVPGFDWDQGRYFLYPSQRLGITEDQTKARLKKVEGIVGHMHLSAFGARKDVTDTQRLERLREHLINLSNALAGDQPPPAQDA